MSVLTFSRLGRYGRFGNQLYQIAGTCGIARRVGFDWAMPEWKNWDGLNFESGLEIDVQQYFVNPLPRYDGPPLPELGVPWGYHDVRPTRSSDLLGHFQSQKYFDHCLDELRWYFTMREEPPLNDYAAIHVRLGDYGEQASPQHPQGNPYHPRMNMSYYGPAFAEFPRDQKYLVFSDGIEECKQMFSESPLIEYSEGRTYFEDFRLMKRCRHFVISNSSFSAMAAVLGEAPDKKVVAPAPWFGGPYTNTLDPKDIYNPDWTVIHYE
jgi:hypothetical protein